jgi:NADH:ubiquinone oxidoreductase subunit H
MVNAVIRFLGYVHVRERPSRVGFVGMLQPFSNAVSYFLNIWIS